MIALLQRVTQAHVSVDRSVVGRIGMGLMVLVGVQRGDGETESARLLERLLSYRVFADDAGRMNRSVLDVRGGLLLVPQFTLAADTRSGTRPGFSTAAPPEEGRRWFDHFLSAARSQPLQVEAGQFGADMQVSLTNDGPVTFWLEVRPPTSA
ncbi:MAG: D-aminoacyl-tRNA deacylase [Steroidobacteraceae bacterium]